MELFLGLQFHFIDQPVLFLPKPCDFYYYSSVVKFEIRDDDASGCSFIVHDCFSYSGFLFSHMKMRVDLSWSVKNCVGILIGLALSVDCFWYDGHFCYVNPINP